MNDALASEVVADQAISGASTLAAEPVGRARHLLVIYNPTAGQRRGRFLERTVAAAEKLGARVTLLETAARGDAENLAREAVAGNVDIVVAAGGDGTANEVANGLAGSALPLGIIPLGTANVLAQEIGMPDSPEKVAAVLAFGRSRLVWPGEILSGDVVATGAPAGKGRRFLMMAGIGFDACIVEGVDASSKRLLGKLAYVQEILYEVCRGRSFRYRVAWAGGTSEAVSVIFSKGHFYAGRFVLAPEARLDEPVLHMVLFTKGGRLATLKCLFALGLGLSTRIPEIRIVATRMAVVTAIGCGKDELEPVEADGDLSGRLPVTVRVASTPLRLVCP